MRRSGWRARRAPRRWCARTAPWREQALELSGGGVDVVLDPVGGERFTDSLRCLREDGRVLVVGFAEGSIPEVKVNRLLLRNVSVVGAGWGAYVMGNPERNRAIGEAVRKMVDEGFVRPIIGACFAFEDAVAAFRDDRPAACPGQGGVERRLSPARTRGARRSRDESSERPPRRAGRREDAQGVRVIRPRFNCAVAPASRQKWRSRRSSEGTPRCRLHRGDGRTGSPARCRSPRL